MMHFTSRNPAVSAVIATNGKRPELLRVAVRSILEQSYRGFVEVVVVFDRVEPDHLEDIEVGENRALKIVSNTRSGGLAGGRNSGIIASSGEMIGFCDDDDYWMPSKLTQQVALWRENPEAAAISSGITVRSGGQDIVRLAPERATFADFLRSRTPLPKFTPPPCCTPARICSALTVSPPASVWSIEELPAAYGEDYDLLLRATRHGDVLSVPEPLILVLWDRPSFFSGKWQSMVDGLSYILRKFPEFEQDPKGLARIAGQIAYAQASLGNNKEARAYARSALRRDPKQLRAWAAYVVSTGIIKPATLLDLVQKTGRGL